MSAFLGAVITAGITLVLLIGQSNAEEIKERNINIYKKKSRLYQNYIKKLNQIIENQPIKIKDFEIVKSEFYSKLVIYLNTKFHKGITDCFEEIADCVVSSIDDHFVTDKDKTENFDKLRRNLINITNIFVKDLGLMGKIDINLLMNTDKILFFKLFRATLLQEVLNCFSKEKELIVKKGFYAYPKDSEYEYIILPLLWKSNPACDILIGPFLKRNKDGVCLASDRLHFKVRAPQIKSMADLYTLKFYNDEKEKEFISLENREMQDKFDEHSFIDLSNSLDSNALEDSELDRNMYNNFIPPFSFENSDVLYSNYHGIYQDMCKAIANRAYYYFRNYFAISQEENQPPLLIRELCIKVGKSAVYEIAN